MPCRATRSDATVGAQDQQNSTSDLGTNYALFKAYPDSENVTITLSWLGHEVNMDRKRNEPIGTTITRLKRSLQKFVNVTSKGDKNAVSDRNAPSTSGVQVKASQDSGVKTKGESGPTSTVDPSSSGLASQEAGPKVPGNFSISFMTNTFKPFDLQQTLVEVAHEASFLSINDTLLKIFNNIFRVMDVKIGHKAVVGCPVTVAIHTDGPCNYKDLLVEWLDEKDQPLYKGTVYIPPEAMNRRRMKVRVSHKKMTWNIVESKFCKVVDAPRNRWQHERVAHFNSAPVATTADPMQSDVRDLRVMSFNILSPTYVSTDEAIQRFFPYCPREWLDSCYRNPLILREILMVKPHILCVQECATSAYRDYIEPILGSQYHSWLTIKNTTSDEGCCIFLQRGIFDILESQSLTFKEEVRKPEYREVLARIGVGNWLNYNEVTYFNRYHTIFQMLCLKNTLDDKNNYLFLANTHLYFHPNGRHIRLLQTYVMLNELERFKERCAQRYGFDIDTESSTIICGDFNSFKTEGTFHLMANGWVPYNHEDFDFGLKYVHEKFNPSQQRAPFHFTRSGTVYYPLETKERLEVENCKGYQDAYSGRELPFTNYVKTFNGTLDYIFHSKNLKVKRCMPGISEKDAQEFEGLPSKIYPSDHISIAVDF
ncbi:putative phosphodiesterase [Babesia sp. Xinjiang]|uniref:putative phosphodiesterase n=1 Tax=Babesia sp. Xinjiang TaxID=462227 RepID=UPI000A24AFD3|nr:putative phosphodiesterase [Babesia sp. Xinjiang]ORM40641.1 putative phosphodiesterase [Babesia sp. Xinjiang]